MVQLRCVLSPALLLFLVSCGGESVCVTGETQICNCAGAVEGAQTCLDDQSGWSVCDCEGDATDSGGDPQDTDTGQGQSFDGAALYIKYCSGCHKADGTGRSGPNIQDEAAEESIDELVEVILEGDDDMPAIPLSYGEAVAIAQWMKATWAQGAECEEEDDDDDEEEDDD